MLNHVKLNPQTEMNNPIRSDPTNPDFVDAALFTSHKGILGYFRSFQKSLQVILGHFKSFFKSLKVTLGHFRNQSKSFWVILGHFKSFKKSLKVILGHFRSFLVLVTTLPVHGQNIDSQSIFKYSFFLLKVKHQL